MIAKERNTFVFEKKPYTETSTTEEIVVGFINP